MTELEKMMRAREYVRKLAEGIDPLTDEEMPLDSIYNNVRLSRCMYFVAEILDKVIANDGEVGGKPKKQKVQFVPCQDDLVTLKPHTENLAITKFIQHLQGQLGEERGKISRAPITDWLIKNELIREIQAGKGTRRVATKNGENIGIQNMEQVGSHGAYTAVYYNTAAQQIIIDALMDIFAE